MKRLFIILTLCAGCLITASAQSSFTQRLQQNNQGEGKVTLTQSKEIDDLVNGTAITSSTPSQTTHRQEKETGSDQTSMSTQEKPNRIVAERRDSTNISDIPDDSPKKVMKGYKVNGYRVQVFAGGNSRRDRIKAERTGDEIKSLLPGEPVYVHFYSPRWICRVGNYRTYEEAHEVLSRVKSLGYQSAIIVKGKITVQYP